MSGDLKNNGTERLSWKDWWLALAGVAITMMAVWIWFNGFTLYTWLIANPVDSWPSLISPKFQDLVTLTLSIIVEALPFVVLGVTVSIAIQQFIPTEKLIRRLPKNIVGRRLIISFMGVAMPVCECGNVPVARGLLARGMTVPESVVFLLAAPIINPVTIIATWEAFSFDHSVAVWRVAAALVIANIVGIVISRFKNPDRFLTTEFKAVCDSSQHSHKSPTAALSLFRSEMWLIMRMLCFGALIAGATQVFVPREVITEIGSSPVLSIVAMLILAFVISICSSVDAFFALAYARTFSTGSIVSFLVAGPMVDIKMLSIMKTTYRLPLLLLISVLVFGLSFLTGLLVNYV